MKDDCRNCEPDAIGVHDHLLELCSEAKWMRWAVLECIPVDVARQRQRSSCVDPAQYAIQGSEDAALRNDLRTRLSELNSEVTRLTEAIKVTRRALRL